MNSINIPQLTIKTQTIVAVIVGILCFTSLRSTLILMAPLVYFLLIIFFSKSISPYVLSIALIVITVSILPILIIFAPFINYVLSILLIIPLLVLLLWPAKRYNIDSDKFIHVLSVILIFINFTGLIQFLYTALTRSGSIDDSFIGLYGTSGLVMHTLSLVNFLFFGYYFLGVKKNLTKSIIFLTSGVLCFYGLGFIIFVIAFLLVLLIKRSIKISYFLFSPILIIAIYGIISTLNPQVINYTAQNIRMIQTGWQSFNYEDEMKTANVYGYTKFPRKLTMFSGVLHRIHDNPEVLLMGSGPGTYNSRTSFLLNGEYSSIALIKKFFQSRPIFASEDIYPLWNRRILKPYNDGTRNEPFSSIVSFPMEYGLPISFLLLAALYKKWRLVFKHSSNKKFLLFLLLFMSLNLLFENYIEYPEAMIIVAIFFKLEETKSKNYEGTSDS